MVGIIDKTMFFYGLWRQDPTPDPTPDLTTRQKVPVYKKKVAVYGQKAAVYDCKPGVYERFVKVFIPKGVNLKKFA